MKVKRLQKAAPRVILGAAFLFLSFSLSAEEFRVEVTRSAGRDGHGALFRSRRIEKNRTEKTCNQLKLSLEKVDFFGSKYDSNAYEEAWKPWSKSDRSAIEECDKFPCSVKLNSRETSLIKTIPEGLRKNFFFGLIDKRIFEYQKSQTRSEYQHAGNPVDPWIKIPEWERAKGTAIEWGVPQTAPSLYLRVHRFTDDSYRPIRQVLDVRVVTSKVGKINKTSVYVRDIYTAHYFDGWGERIEISCNEETKEVTLDQIMVVEFDLYKKTDFLSRMSQSTMTKNLHDLTEVYQLKERSAFFKDLGFYALPASPRPRY